MNFQNRSSSSISDHQNVLPSNPYDDAMDVDFEECSTSVSGSDHCDSTASFSIFSDSEIPELSDEEFLEENSSESSSNHSDRGGAIVNVEQAVENQRYLEEEAIDDEEDENLLEVFSDSSESLYDERDFASSSDEGEVASVLNEEEGDGDDPFHYSLEEPILIVMSSDDGSEVASEHEEELEEATLEEEPVDVDRSEVGSEHSEHSLENVIDPPKYSTENPGWLELSSDEDSEVASETEKKS